MKDNRKILEMLSSGKINIDEAERLLAALSDHSIQQDHSGSAAPSGRKVKYLRVLVEPGPGSESNDRVNVRVPINLIRAGLKWAAFLPKHAQGPVNDALKEKGFDFDINKLTPGDLEELVSNLNDLEVQVEGKETVKVYCE